MVLTQIQEYWRSDDPWDRYIALFGKILVEMGTAVLIAIIIYTPFALIDWLFNTFCRFDDPLFALMSVATISSVLATIVFCTVITREDNELDESIEDAFSQTTGSDSDASSSTEES